MPCPKRCARGSAKKVRHSSGPTDCSTGVRGSSTDSTASPHAEATACGGTPTPPPTVVEGPGDRFRRVQHSTELDGATARRRHAAPSPPSTTAGPASTTTSGCATRTTPEVTAHLEAENAYTAGAHRPPRRPAAGDLRRDQGPHPETDLSVPTRNRGYWYYGRSFEGKEYGASCRVPVADPDDWTPAAARRGLRAGPAGAARRAGAARPRRAGRGPRLLLARRLVASAPTAPCSPTRPTSSATSATRSGSRTSRTGELLARRDHRRPRRRHLGPRRRAPLLHDRRRRPGAPTRSGGTGSAPPRPTTSWSTTRPTTASGSASAAAAATGSWSIASGSKITTEYRFLDADDPDAGFRVFARAREGLEYSLDHAVIGGEDVFLVLHNDTGAGLRARHRARSRPPPPEDWQPLVAHDPAVRLEDVDAFAGHLVVHQRSEGLTQLRILELGDDRAGRRRLPGRVRRRGLHRRLGRQPELRPARRSGSATRRWRCPPSVYDYDVRTRELTLLRRTPVLGGYDPADYEEHRLWATAEDGDAGADLDRVPRAAPRGDGPVADRCSTATAPTRPRSTRTSRSPGSRCSTAARPSRSPTCAAAARWAGAGTTTASCSTSSTPSPTSSPAPGTSSTTGWTTAGPAGRRGRQRRRPADGRGRQPGAGAVRRRSSPRCRSSTR